jgi:hypothetical protein
MDLELFKDLCSRLPYGTIVNVDNGKYREDVKLRAYILDTTDDWDPKPYLRPLSSITKEEREEVEILIFGEWFAQDSGKVDGEGWIEILANYDVSGIDPGFCSDYVDWLLSHHFDFRWLIEKGLAKEAPAGMYE